MLPPLLSRVDIINLSWHFPAGPVVASDALARGKKLVWFQLWLIFNIFIILDNNKGQNISRNEKQIP